jgi:hypothetical protein
MTKANEPESIELKRAFQMLESLGMPKNRARTVSNGIASLDLRYLNHIQSLRQRIRMLELALVRACFSLHATDANQLPEGIRLIDAEKVEVDVAGETVSAGLKFLADKDERVSHEQFERHVKVLHGRGNTVSGPRTLAWVEKTEPYDEHEFFGFFLNGNFSKEDLQLLVLVLEAREKDNV